MDITGKLIMMLPLQTGEGKNGPWKKQDIIIEIPGQYPKKVSIAVWGDKMDLSLLQLGNNLKVSFDIESREYNSKWYTDVKAWKLELSGAAETPSAPYTPAASAAPAPSFAAVPAESFSAETEDNLPF